MNEDQSHRGIRYRVRSLQARRWKWEVEPPAAVLGLKPESGELDGDRDDAVRAAKMAIESQTRQFGL